MVCIRTVGILLTRHQLSLLTHHPCSVMGVLVVPLVHEPLILLFIGVYRPVIPNLRQLVISLSLSLRVLGFLRVRG
jgi:hypothetical protein